MEEVLSEPCRIEESSPRGTKEGDRLNKEYAVSRIVESVEKCRTYADKLSTRRIASLGG